MYKNSLKIMANPQALAKELRSGISGFREYLDSIDGCLGKIQTGEGDRLRLTVDDECHRLRFLAMAITDLADKTRDKNRFP